MRRAWAASRLLACGIGSEGHRVSVPDPVCMAWPVKRSCPPTPGSAGLGVRCAPCSGALDPWMLDGSLSMRFAQGRRVWRAKRSCTRCRWTLGPMAPCSCWTHDADCQIFLKEKFSMKATCACGKASITVDALPEVLSVCHCANCKRRTGSAFGMSAYFDRGAVVRQQGDTCIYAFHHHELGHDQERHFCSSCGTTLFWYISSMPNRIGVAGGCFEDGVLPDPGGSCCEDKRLPWVGLPGHWHRDAG